MSSLTRVERVFHFLNRVGVRKPVIQAPLSSELCNPDLAATVCNSGALGSIASGLLPVDKIKKDIQRVKTLTHHPFAVHMYVPHIKKRTSKSRNSWPRPANRAKVKEMNQQFQPIRDTLGIKTPARLPTLESFENLLNTVIAERVPIISMSLGIPSPEVIATLKKNNVIILGTATTVDEGLAWEAAGADAVIAQGCESGGMRATFLEEQIPESNIGAMALVPSMVDALKAPVIASGGIMDGRGVVAAFALGAVAVQMKTAFVCCAESAINVAYKSQLLDASETDPQFSSSYTGRPGRLIRNKFTSTMQDHLPFPSQHLLTQDIRAESSKQQRVDIQAMWAGQGVRLLRSHKEHTDSARVLIKALGKDSMETMQEVQEIYEGIVRLRKYY